MERYRLPRDISGLDVEAIREKVLEGAIRLDWTEVEIAPSDVLGRLVKGLDLSELYDALGFDAAPAAILDAVAAVREGPAKQAPKRKAKAKPKKSDPAVFRPAATSPAAPAGPGWQGTATGSTGVPTGPGGPSLAPLGTIELREKLLGLVTRDLLGPGSLDEELADKPAPRQRYILGFLAPSEQEEEAKEDEEVPEEVEISGVSGGEDGQAEERAASRESFLPSSLGLSFCVPQEHGRIEVTAEWGAYEKGEDPRATVDDKGKTKRIWKRTQQQGAVTVDLAAAVAGTGTIAPIAPVPSEGDVVVQGIVRRRGNHLIVSLFLVNRRVVPKANAGLARNIDEAYLFQAGLKVRAPDGGPVFVGRSMAEERQEDTHPDEDDRQAEMRYREHCEFAVGHGVSVHAVNATNDPTRAVELQTTWLPRTEALQQAGPTEVAYPGLKDLVVDMQVLAAVEQGQFAPKLSPLLVAYEEWIAAREGEAKKRAAGLGAYDAEALGALKKCKEALVRLREGIACLDTSPTAADAFRFANEAMALQRVRSAFSAARRRDPKARLQDFETASIRSWYPFQLAFLLMNVPALSDLQHKDRSDSATAVADLLWFPTGGGKTEAYLGCAAFAMACRRLRGTVEGRSGDSGVAVLMRYTLRLLTIQQFQRAAALACACEVIRRRDPKKWGLEPFRLGLWVGMRTTPNWTADAKEALNAAHGHGRSTMAAGSGSPAQLTNCPWCGAEINPGRQCIKVEGFEEGRGRTFTYCGDASGQCDFSAKQSNGEGIPVLVVDEEIYRRLPSLLIATVDKFAQMPWRGEIQALFGRVNSYCPRHGFRTPDLPDEERHNKKGSFEAVHSRPVPFLQPPDLIIQDELHLISGPLGTLVGLYETAIDELSSWEVAGKRVRPKVIASTATITHAGEQVRGLFARDVSVFPPQGLVAGDTFFSHEVPSTQASPGRLYLGICAPGQRMVSTLVRVYAAFLAGAQKLFQDYGNSVDAWMTLVGYFNSLRELGGMRRLVDDQVSARLQRMNQSGLANRLSLLVEELTSRRSSTDIPELLSKVEVPFDLAAAQARATAPRGHPAHDAPRPIDLLLATNMISVGVDVGRLGLMIVTSQPKTTAEYIQATSRVGRKTPGVVVTVYNWARPRDLSHFETFEHYHATFYKRVEPLSVTPFAIRAIDRGLSAVLVALTRLAAERFNKNEDAEAFDPTDAIVQRAVAVVLDRASVVTSDADLLKHLQKALNNRVREWVAKRDQAKAGFSLGYQKRSGEQRGLLQGPIDGNWELFTCLRSLRDVEESVPLVLDVTKS